MNVEDSLEVGEIGEIGVGEFDAESSTENADAADGEDGAGIGEFVFVRAFDAAAMALRLPSSR